jgi:hypothetical protein
VTKYTCRDMIVKINDVHVGIVTGIDWGKDKNKTDIVKVVYT